MVYLFLLYYLNGVAKWQSYIYLLELANSIFILLHLKFCISMFDTCFLDLVLLNNGNLSADYVTGFTKLEVSI